MAQIKSGKKKWYKIHASEDFNKVIIGESLVNDPKMLIGRDLETSLAFLIHDPKKQNFRARFKIKEIKDEEAYTDLIKIYILPTFVKRFIRQSKSKIEESFEVKTKNGLKVVVKPFLITRNLVSNSVKSSLRKKCREFLSNYFNNKDYGNIVNSLLKDSLQKELRKVLSKVYPLTACHIRVFERK